MRLICWFFVKEDTVWTGNVVQMETLQLETPHVHKKDIHDMASRVETLFSVICTLDPRYSDTKFSDNP